MKADRSVSRTRADRMMVYCHDSVGIGHLRRSIAICERLTSRFPGSSFLIATGTPYVPLFTIPRGMDYVKLPALNKRSDGVYESKFLPLRTRQLLKCRRALLLATVQYFRPSIFLVDKNPVGVCRELVPVLQWLRRNCPQTRVVFGMRDIEDTPEATIRQWNDQDVPRVLEECYDEIWVYGSQSVYDVVREYRLPQSVCNKLSYTGYIERNPCDHDTSEARRHESTEGRRERKGQRDEGTKGRRECPIVDRQSSIVNPQSPIPNHQHVLVTVGGGSDGVELLGKYIAEAAGTVAKRGGRSTIVAGPDVPRGAARWLRQAALDLPETRWLDHTGCMSCLMRSADLVVSMGGYNTLCEIASYGKAALVVPRVFPRYEQAIRATIWERLGVISTAHPATLTPRRLSERVLEMLDNPRAPDSSRLDLHGLDRIADKCAVLWNGGRSVEAPVRV
ncbi:MAG: glycosyltransferase [Phycisphaerae bacterium]